MTKAKSEIEELYEELLFDIEEEIIKGLHQEEKDTWRKYFKDALFQNGDYFELHTTFSKVRWGFASHLVKELISAVYSDSPRGVDKDQIAELLQEVKKLFDDAIVNGSWDRSLEWPIESKLMDALDETVEGEAFPIVKGEFIPLHNSLDATINLVRNNDIKKALSTVIFLTVIRSQSLASSASKAKESLFSRIFSTVEVDKRARAESVKEHKVVKPEEHKRHARVFLSLLQD